MISTQEQIDMRQQAGQECSDMVAVCRPDSVTELYELAVTYHKRGQLEEAKSRQDALVGFSDTAALIQTMDLVISVDTSLAHVAVEMNKPCCVLLPYSPDFVGC